MAEGLLSLKSLFSLAQKRAMETIIKTNNKTVNKNYCFLLYRQYFLLRYNNAVGVK